MAIRSQRITFRDIRLMTDTVHECRDLWVDPPAWKSHLMERVCTLSGCRVGLYFEMGDQGGKSANRIIAAHDAGWESASERQKVVEGLACRPLRYSPLWANFADALPARGRGTGVLTLPQARVIDVKEWQSSEMYDRHIRPTQLGEAMLSAVWLPQRQSWSAWSLVTDRGERSHTSRGQRLVRLLHQQIAPLIGVVLSTSRDRTIAPLSSVRRQVLQMLLDGLAEAHIATALHRSHSAIHEHVTALYRHFGVRSRAELSAFFLQRRVIPNDAKDVASADAWLRRRWTNGSD